MLIAWKGYSFFLGISIFTLQARASSYFEPPRRGGILAVAAEREPQFLFPASALPSKSFAEGIRLKCTRLSPKKEEEENEEIPRKEKRRGGGGEIATIGGNSWSEKKVNAAAAQWCAKFPPPPPESIYLFHTHTPDPGRIFFFWLQFLMCWLACRRLNRGIWQAEAEAEGTLGRGKESSYAKTDRPNGKNEKKSRRKKSGHFSSV